MKLIDADELMRKLVEYREKTKQETYISSVALDSIIGTAPRIDAEQVVRCKDCELWKQKDGFDLCKLAKEEDYCSWGLERDGGNE